MRLEAIRATAHPGREDPDRHRIDLVWVNPAPADYPGVRVVRREGRHPLGPGDGVVVAEGTEPAAETDDRGRPLHRVADEAVTGGIVYYYALFPYRGDPPEYAVERANRTAALASAPRGTAARMFSLLPAVYHRYDAAAGGSLRAFLDLAGGELDVLESYARSALDLHDIERVDGRLLSLLAQWIGWKTDFRLEVDRQRREVRDATALYRRVGMIPVVGATVKRISGWESRSKEFVHNVARSNRPPRLNLRARHLDSGAPGVPGVDASLSMDFAYEGRPSAVVDDHGVRWLFYHTLRRGGWRLWCKTSPTFPLPAEARGYLEAADAPALQRAFAAAGVEIAADAAVQDVGSLWHVDDATNGERYVVERGERGLTAYHTSAGPLEMAPSHPLPGGGPGDEKGPVAVLQGETLWLFWSAYDAASGRWEMRWRTRRDGTWSDARTRLWEAAEAAVPERRSPAAGVDQDGGLWLFWLEREGRRWRLRYNRHDGTGLPADPAAGWALAAPAAFPLDGGVDPRVEADLSVLFHPGDAGRRLWVFWARKDDGGAGQRRWRVAYRVKAGTDPAAADWGPVEALPPGDPAAHDREPAARVDGDGNVALYWSGDRDGSWSVWRDTLDLAAGPAWVGAEAVTRPPYAQRDPLPVPLEAETLLVYRSNESVQYQSTVYAATRTVDFRYAGSTTVHTRHRAITLRGEFEDFQTYSYDTGTEEGDWYRRDTLGVYVRPDTVDAVAVERGLGRLRRVIREFIPATDRAVFIARPDVHVDHAYTYEAPAADAPAFIGESWADALELSANEAALPPDTDFTDALE